MSKTILITGTSSGLGRATAKLFQAEGWKVVATMRNPDAETEVASLDRMIVTRLDVQDTACIQSAVEAGIARFGGIDALVNNAGYGAYGPLEATPPEAIRRQFARTFPRRRLASFQSHPKVAVPRRLFLTRECGRPSCSRTFVGLGFLDERRAIDRGTRPPVGGPPAR